MKTKVKTLILILLVIIIAVSLVLWLYRNIFFPRKYREIVEQACATYNVDPNLIYAVMKRESKFNKEAVSHSGAKGLMQLMDATANDMARSINTIDENDYDIFDPYTNIFIGTKYIAYLTNHFDGNYYLAITAYNAGMGKIGEWLDKPYTEYTDFATLYECIEYKETRDYLDFVINYYNFYTKLYG